MLNNDLRLGSLYSELLATFDSVADSPIQLKKTTVTNMWMMFRTLLV